MFADDLKLLRKIESEADCLALQNELDSISLWFSTLGLQFNTYKCKAMFFTKRRLVFDYSYTINGSVIDRVASNSDLGVLFTADLNFRPHIDSICCRALKSLGFVMRTMNEFKLFGSLKTVYCSLVRSMLEYASVLWDPFVVTDSCHLERVQRRFLSSAAYMLKIVHPPHDYTPVLRALGLTSLADRRVKANLAFLKKLIDGSSNAPSLLVQVTFKVPHRATRSRVPFAVPLHFSRKHIMTQNNDLLSSELNKWTKSMLVDYIVAQTLPAGVKLSDDLSMFLKDSSSDPVSPSHGNLINIANILQSVVVELKSVALSNAKLHDKLNHLNAAPNAQTPKSNAQLFKRPVDVHPNSVTGNRSTQPTNQLTASQSSSVKSKFIVGSVKNSSSKLSSMPVRKHVDIFVSRLDPSVTTALLESELFNGYPDVTISKMVTRHPSYSSFHIRLPADKLDIVLDPAFLPDGVMVKRFWGRLAPEMIQDATPKN
ncbi:hypothetical protein QTP88_028458 [Uroleucon formosanum]